MSSERRGGGAVSWWGLIRDRTLLKTIEENGANTNVAIQDLQKDITTEAAAQELWRRKDRDKNIGAGKNILACRT